MIHPSQWGEVLRLKAVYTHCRDVSAAICWVDCQVGASVHLCFLGKWITLLFVLSVSDGSAIFKGCFRRPDNITLALPLSAVIQNMSVDKCVDMCTEKVRGHVYSGILHLCMWVPLQCVMPSVFQDKSLAVLAGERCLCGFPTHLFSLHEQEDEGMCLHRCHGEEFESCGNDEYFVVYQTQVQGTFLTDRGCGVLV